MKIKSITIENFKGIQKMTIAFNDVTEICGANATGKTTVFDALTWLLFDKDSLGNSKFDIRTLDADGNKIHNTEIMVMAIMDIDGKEVTIKKVQKENWVKKRGSDVAELQGNKNEFEIDGFPKSAKDYQSFISGIVDEDLFKMLTNPMFFPTMKWQEQRAILMKMLPDVSDIEIAKECGYEEIIPDLEKADSLEDVRAKYAKGVKEWKKKQAELPVRIDEVSKQKVVVDVASLGKAKAECDDKLKSIQKKYEELENKISDNREIESQIMELKFEQAQVEKEHNSANQKRREKVNKDIEDKKSTLMAQRTDIRILEGQIIADKALLEKINADGVELNRKYARVVQRRFDGTDDVCPTCGQKMPKSALEHAEADFEEWKANELKAIKETGKNLNVQKQSAEDRISKNSKEIEETQKSVDVLETELLKLEKTLKAIPADAEPNTIDEWNKLQKSIDARQELLSQPMPYDKYALDHEETEIRNQIASLDSELHKAEQNKAIDARIEELRAEQLEVAQMVADAEKMLYQLEEFTRAKMEKVSSLIDAKFDGINWKLFEMQINGGMRECCELTVGGVPYSSLNNGHRIISGLQIIKTLQKEFDVSVPVFVDNAEAISDGNFPDMECQVVKLIVTDDAELTIK